VAFSGVLSKHVPFAPFALAILVSCRCAGRAGGLVATVASAVVLRAWFLAPAASLLDEGRLGLVLFVAAGLIVSWQGSGQKQAPVVKATRVVEPDVVPFEYAGPVHKAA
jgi:hypothetical protein